MNNYSPYFDGHNDVLLKLLFSKEKNKTKEFFNGNDYCHIDFPKIKKSKFVGGFFAIFVPEKVPDESLFSKMASKSYSYDLPSPLKYDHSIATTISMIDILKNIIKNSNNEIILFTNKNDIINFDHENQIGIILHIEGAEAISENFDSLEILYELGLRSIGLVWSRSNIYGNGVPFKFPSSPDIGSGLTLKGKELVKESNNLKILIDLSHLNEKGFWDVAKISNSPLIATHSNCHEICNHSRNLTNDQFKAINDSGGFVGLNFATAFLREDGQMIDTDLDILIRHLDHMIKHLGENNVGIGSDFDGAKVPSKIKDLTGMNNLKNEMIKFNYSEELIDKIFYKNLLNFLKENF